MINKNNFLFVLSFVICLGFFHKAKAQQLYINEILSSNTTGITDSYGNYPDWIEIYNAGTTAINLEGYFLSDKVDNPQKWSFPSVQLPAKGFLLVFATEEESTADEIHTNFKISSKGEALLLSDNQGNLIYRMDSIPLRANISYGHKPDASGSLKYFDAPTPGASNTSNGYDGFAVEPELNYPSGFYTENINVSYTHPDPSILVRYTLDGSEPDQNSPIFNESLTFQDAAIKPNTISLIPTNPSFDFPKPGFDEDRANNRGWLPPYSTINKTNILKVKAFKETTIPSNTLSATYFINPEGSNRYSLPVMSIITPETGFFSNPTGIYVYGTTGALGNYYESGREWERPIVMHFFDTEGNLAFEQQFGARIHGGGGRHSTQKNLRMYARDEYGKSSLEYNWFNRPDITEFERFMVRGPGHTPNCIARDDLADLLLEDQDVDVQHIRPVIVFLNGAYWGIHSVKERFDQEYLKIKYGKKEAEYVVLKNSGTLVDGEPGDEDYYNDMIDFIDDNDLSIEENYNYVKTQIDLDNYLSYLSTEIFLGNVDWVMTNIKYWRYKGAQKNAQSNTNNPLDGRWRWFFFDFDITFGQSCDEVSYTSNVLKKAFDDSEEYYKYTILARGLKQNTDFVNQFVNRTCDMMNSCFNHRNMEEKINEIDNAMRPEMLEHVDKWRYPSAVETLAERENEIPSLDKWNEIIDGLHEFNDNRKRKVIEHYTEAFELMDTVNVRLEVNDVAMGSIKINSILVSEALEGVNENVYPWQGTYFADIPIQLIAVPKWGYRFVEWEESGSTLDTLNLQVYFNQTFTAIFEKDPDFSETLYINEFMASNKTTIADEEGTYSDWIEIYNPNDQEVDLAGFFLSDDLEKTTEYQIPSGYHSTIIPAHGFLLLWADDLPSRGPLHTNFKLSAGGEAISLYAPDTTFIDAITYGEQSEDISYGRETDGGDDWIFFEKPDGPTPGFSNNTAAIDDMEFSTSLKIYPNPAQQGHTVYFTNEANIEVYNLLGKRVFKGEHINRLDTQGFKVGAYIIKTEKQGTKKLFLF